MPAKAPIYLKPINSKKGKKCRLRDMLSPDMISPPLGDFRHTVHIGRGGDRDTFGDMSFLQGKFELLPGKDAIAQPLFGVQNDYLRTNSTSDASFAETPSPVLKNAISLPTIGGGQALTLPLISCGVYPLPPEPLEDIVGASSSASMNPDRMQELEIMQMDELLRSIEVFSRKPSPPPIGAVRTKPDVLLDLAPEKPEEPISKAVSKANKTNKGERGREKPSPYYISSGSNKGSFKANGSLYSSASSDSYDSYDGKGHGGAVYDGSPSGNSDRGGFNGNGNGNCNGYGRFNSDIALGYEKELSSDCIGDWADRDSGLEEGGRIICDFDFPNKGKRCVSQDSLAQITGSLLSLELDLGPSILDDVLNIMNQPATKSRP